jgi:methyl-accepting chemotaxis protein
MSLLANARIVTKLIGVIGLIAVTVSGGIWFATSRMAQIDADYSYFLDHEAQAWAMAARVSRNFYQLRYLLLWMIAETGEDEMAKARREYEKASEESAILSKFIKDNAPHFAAEVDALSATLAGIGQAAETVMKLALANKKAEALELYRSVVDPKLEDLVREAVELRAKLDDVARSTSAKLNDAAGATIKLTVALITALLLLSASAAILLAQFGIVRPIRALVGCMEALATGRHDVTVPGTGCKDEIGTMARAVEIFRHNGIEVERMRAEQAEQGRRARELRKAEMQELADQFQAAIGNIVDTVSSAATELEAAACTLTKTAETTQRLSGIVTAASEEASSNVSTVASAAEEMSTSVNEIARQVQESSGIAGEAVQQAEHTDSHITELSQAASRIGDVVKFIAAIAEQTNLLALNATIEAARAGESGKGFAVVAQEVKALAAQSAKATHEIGAQITSMQMATAESVLAIKEIGGTIKRVSEIASTIAAAIEQQGAATQEISRNVAEAASRAAEVARTIVDVNRGAGETGSASAQVLSSARSLAGESNRLKVEVEKFLKSVRAA